MGQPILTGYNFKIERKRNRGTYKMSSMDMYKDYHSFGYLYEGNRVITTPEKSCTIQPGTIVFIHKDMLHRTSGMVDIEYENFSIKFRDCVIERLRSTVGEQQLSTLFTQIVMQLDEDADKKVRDMISRIEEEWNSYNEQSNRMLECLFTEMLLIIIRSREAQLISQVELSGKKKILTDAMNYLEVNYALDPSLEQTAEAINVSSSYLSRLFSTEMEFKYSAYLSHVKIEHAQALLVNSKLPISEIALQTGFKNSNYFSDAFKKSVGSSPNAYR